MEQREDADQAARADVIDAGRRRRVVRALGSAAAAVVLAVGFLATSVASVPWNDFPSHRYDVVVSEASPSPSSIGRVGTTGTTAPEGPQTVAQLIDVLGEAERGAVLAGQPRTSEMDQAAAELGMLLSIYVAQQSALDDPRPGIVAARTSDVRNVDAGDAVPVDDASTVSNVVVPDGGGSPADETGTATDPHEEPHADEGIEAAHEHGDEEVTFDDVVVAAMRLANLLDPAAASYVAEILPSGERPGIGVVRAELTESLLAVVERYAGSTDGYQNGRIPASVLCPLEFAPGHLLRCDAADQLTKLSEAYEAEFGEPIPITDSYRSYDAQVAVRAAKPHLAAVPGTSNHGWGLAVDLSYPISTGQAAEYVWLRVHGPDFGWDNPAWARPDGSKPEPWHFEFFAGGPIPDRAWSSSDVSTGGGTTAPQEDEEDPGTFEPAVRPAEPEPKPKPSPSLSPSPTPKPSPSEPSPSPSEPSPSPSPSEPSPSPSEPAPSPSPTETEPATEPEPAPEPATEPAPEPEPEPEPATEPAPEPEPTATETQSAPEPTQSESTADQTVTTTDSGDATTSDDTTSTADEGGA